MGKRRKRIERLLARPPEARYDDVRIVLEEFGWIRRSRSSRKGSSHEVFEKSGEYPITVPLIQGRLVKKTYVIQICERLGLDDLDLASLD